MHSYRNEMLQAATLATLERIRHAFFTRSGGVSEGVMLRTMAASVLAIRRTKWPKTAHAWRRYSE